MSFVCYSKEPYFPATDQNQAATRTQMGAYWVDWWGVQPTQTEVDDRMNPPAAQLQAEAKANAKALYAGTKEPSRIDRAIVAEAVDELNILRRTVVGVATIAWDPANMANGTGVTSPAITVIGAAFGDAVDVAAPYSLNGIIACAYVSAANTVVIRLHNGTGGAVNLGNGTWRVGVRRYAAMPDRTYLQAKAAIEALIDNDI